MPAPSDMPPREVLSQLRRFNFGPPVLSAEGYWLFDAPGDQQSGIFYDGRIVTRWGYYFIDLDGCEVYVYTYDLESLCRLLGLIERGQM